MTVSEVRAKEEDVNMATGELKGFIDMELKYGDLALDQMKWAYNNLRRLESGAYYMAKHPEMFSDDDRYRMFAILDNASHNVGYIRNCINTLNEYFNVIEGEKEE